MFKRDTKGVHRGSALGLLWIVLSPLVQTLSYVLIVVFFFNSRAADPLNPFAYALYVLGGLIPWQLITRTLIEAPSLVRSRSEMVKQVPYPIETLPFNNCATAAIFALSSLLIYLFFSALSGTLSLSLLLLPVALGMLFIFLTGLSWILLVVGVLFMDIKEIVSIAFGLLIYVTPVVLSEQIIGPKLWSYIQLNPFSHVVLVFRDVLSGSFHPSSWGIFAAMALFAYVIGGLVISRSKGFLNDYL